MSIKVTIADDHPIAREGLRQYLQREDDIEVVAEVDSGSALLETLREPDGRPDVVLVDARMPSLDGIEATRMIHESFDGVKVIVLSAYDDPDLVLRAMSAGAYAYLLKSNDGGRITSVIRLVAEGDVVIDHAVAGSLLRELPERAPKKTSAAALSETEIEVLRLLSDGHTNKEIARELSVSQETIKGRLTRLFRKLGASDRAAAVAEGFRRQAIE
jgi:DNA-binding NarL/FixJ family response regulator